VIGILEWIQYNLDRHGSVAEVLADAEAVRPMSRVTIHYLVADATGDAAALEFLDGKARRPSWRGHAGPSVDQLDLLRLGRRLRKGEG
jgi:hypothetical protein